MVASELRIGSKIQHKNRNGLYVCYVIEILEKGVNVKAKGQFGEWFLRFEELNPIPLSEEILINSGGEIKPLSLGVEFDRFRFIWKEEYNYWYVVDVTCRCYMTKIEFVHEFQNFIFVMNGKELEVKL